MAEESVFVCLPTRHHPGGEHDESPSMLSKAHMAWTKPMTTRESICPATQIRTRPGYIPALDGLRGMAILFVMGNHVPLRQVQSLLPGGFVGVDIFFVLSGFLITSLLIQEFDRTGSIGLRNFYMRRALRLGPALIALLVVYCLSSFVLFDQARARGNCVDALIALFYASNWVRVFSKNQLGLLAHTWSLSTEEQFYILWPIILLTLLRASKKRRYIAAVAAAVALLSWLAGIRLALKGASTIRICFALDSRADTLMIGCILGVALSSGPMTEQARKMVQKLLAIMAPLSLACLPAFSISGNVFGRGLFYYGFVIMALLAAALILDVLVSRRSIVGRFLAMKWLVWIGSISYGLYLWHWPIFWGMHGFGFKGWTVVLAGTPLTFLIVLLSYYGMERPILELKKRFNPDSRLNEAALQAGEQPRTGL
jgi:peptidoglycan/LPS O-acetylase OafA/YrhL